LINSIVTVWKGADADVANKDGETPLWWAAAEGFMAMLEELTKRGAAVDCVDKHGKTPLFMACVNGHAAAAGFLISKGVDVNRATKVGGVLNI
jgi:ankyrin repeat protein